MAPSQVETVLKDTMNTLNIIGKVRPPPTRGGPSLSRPDEEENVGLTTGKSVPRWRARSCLIGCCCALMALIVGLVVGLVVDHFHLVDTDKIVGMVPFFPRPDAPLNFLVVGDWGRDGKFNQSWVAESMGVVASRLQADFIISTGDNFYLDGLHNVSDPQFETSFSNVYSARSLMKQWFAVLGNHDYHVAPDVEVDTALKDRDFRWHCEKNYRRKFKACPKDHTGFCPFMVEIFFIDTSPLLAHYWSNETSEPLNFTGMPDRAHSINFVLNILKDGLESSDAFWKVVVGHHPIFSTGEHGNTFELHTYVLPILKRFNVDLYLNGHDHNLEFIQVPEMTTYFVTSGAGSMTRTQRNGQIPGTTLFYHDLQGFTSVSASGPTLDVRFYNVTGHQMYNMTIGKVSR